MFLLAVATLLGPGVWRAALALAGCCIACGARSGLVGAETDRTEGTGGRITGTGAAPSSTGGGDEPPPVDEPPIDEPPIDEPPIDEPPIDEPPIDEPPIGCSRGGCPDDGNVCNGYELCDRATDECVTVEVDPCDDGVACNGAETCDPELGCVPGAPIVCASPHATCDERTAACVCDDAYLGADCNVRTAFYAQLGGVQDMLEVGNVLWIATSSSVWALDHGGTPSDPTDDARIRFEAADGAIGRTAVAIDEAGDLWFLGVPGTTLALLDYGGTPLDPRDDQWQSLSNPSANRGRSLAIDGVGRVWLGRNAEPWVFDSADDTWLRVGELGAPAALQGETDTAAIASDHGVVWLASVLEGLFAFDEAEAQFVALNAPGTEHVHELAPTLGGLWLASAAADEPRQPRTVVRLDPGASVLDPSDDSSTAYPSPMDAGTIEALAVDEGNRVWTGWVGQGLACLDPPTAGWTRLDVEGDVASVTPRSDHDLWFGGARGPYYLEYGGTCDTGDDELVFLGAQTGLRSPARDVAPEGAGVWFATALGVDYLDTGGTPFEASDDRWAHFDAGDEPKLGDLQGVVTDSSGLKYFWATQAVFALDDAGTPLDKEDDTWVAHETPEELWVQGTLDAAGRLLIVERADNQEPTVLVWDLASTPLDGADDTLTRIHSDLDGTGRTIAMDTAGNLWVGIEGEASASDLYHWDRAGTPADDSDDVWTAVAERAGMVYKLVGDPEGGIWGSIGGFGGDVFYFDDGGTPTRTGDDRWAYYTGVSSPLEIEVGGHAWFRAPGGTARVDTKGTRLDPSDDELHAFVRGGILEFGTDLYSNGALDDAGRLWLAAADVQVLEVVE